MTLRAAMLTDVGVVREHNEDSAHVDPAHRFFIVADGMGGHAAGEVASDMAVQTVRKTLDEASEDIQAFAGHPDEEGRKGLVTLLETAVRAAHRAVFERGSRETDKQGMGTTLEVVLVAGTEAFIAHVGDSRTYLVREGHAAQITTDHTVAEVLVLEGKLSAEEAQMSPLRTILVNAIGVAPDVGIEMAHVQLHDGDLLLLCSDGLHDYFSSEQELAERLDDREPNEALTEMVELAKERGGHDNITGIVVHVLDVDDEFEGGEPTEERVPAVPEMLLNDPLSDGIPDAVHEPDSAEADTLPVDADESGPANGGGALHNKPGASAPAQGADGATTGDEVGNGDGDGEEDDDEDSTRPTQPMEVVEPPDDEA